MTILTYGIKTEYTYGYGGDNSCEKVKELIASFDTYELAHAYAKSSEMKSKNLYKYKANSLLRNYDDYELEDEYTPPHNPTVDKWCFIDTIKVMKKEL